jgi:hypothetical protein
MGKKKEVEQLEGPGVGRGIILKVLEGKKKAAWTGLMLPRIEMVMNIWVT